MHYGICASGEAELTTTENTITYHNALCFSPQNFAYALLSVSLGTILTSKRNKILGCQTKSIMVCYDIFWSGQLNVSFLSRASGKVHMKICKKISATETFMNFYWENKSAFIPLVEPAF